MIHEHVISVQTFERNLELTTREYPIARFRYVEELLYDILEKQGVGPVYRSLFGLKIFNSDIWLAPNVLVKDIVDISSENQEELLLEVRLRFKPTFLTKLSVLDKPAFDIIFSQFRHDFLNAQFKNERSDLILLNNTVICLIAFDLLRFALEHKIEPKDILKRAKAKDFVPRRASAWQKCIVFHLKDQLNLKNLVQICMRQCDGKLQTVKMKYMSVFLHDVFPDYGTEAYEVNYLNINDTKNRLYLRVRFNDSEHPYCFIETIEKDASPREPWKIIGDIYSICYGTLCGKLVEINRSNGSPQRFEFDSNMHAMSFLSLVSGYYRLMRKWNFSFCRAVSSPDLDQLIKSKIHGPIGVQTMKAKLTKLKKPGTFIIRRCMEKCNRYLIDVLLMSGKRVCIPIDWYPEEKVYTKSNDSKVTIPENITIVLNEPFYSDVKTLVNDVQIKLNYQDDAYPPLQLKHWLQPSEFDSCPALLLSIPKTEMNKMEQQSDSAAGMEFSELPKVVSPEMLEVCTDISRKSIKVTLATLNKERTVVAKFLNESAKPNHRAIARHKNRVKRNLVFSLKQPQQTGDLKLSQVRLADWIFVKHPLFAETLGFEVTRSGLIQEHFPLGRLDKYLQSYDDSIMRSSGRSISCQMASALLFLQEKRIVHGKLRCHNVFVANKSPLQIKIADPLGTVDVSNDIAFLPPEYIASSGLVQVLEFDPTIDVWAFATTLWQVYSKGKWPPAGRYATTLIQPPACPDQIWRLLETCWSIEPTSRVSAQAILRDLNDYFAWGQDSHFYEMLGNKIEPKVETLEPADTPNKSSSSSSCDSEAPLAIEEPKSQPKQWVVGDFAGFKRGSSKSDETSQSDGSNNYNKFSNSNCSTLDFEIKTASTVLKDEDDLCETDDELDLGQNKSIWTIDSSRVKLGSEIGRGSSGLVIKGVLTQWENLNKQVVAVKCLNSDVGYSAAALADLKREFEILKSLNHDNIIRTLGLVDEDCIMLVMEYMPLGSLLSYLKNSHDQLTSLPLTKYGHDVASAMVYLESKKIIHGDLALRNVLLKSEYEVKLCDFGLAHFIGSNNEYRLKTDRALPVRWLAPESITTSKFSHKSDVWSYGIVLWEIFSGGSNPQYSGTYGDLSVTLEHERLLRPEKCPTQIYDLMLACWAYSPDDRPTFTKIVETLGPMGSI